MGYSSVWEGTQGNGLIWENSRGKFPKRATQFRSFVRQLYRYGFRKGFHGEQLLPPQWEGPHSRMQELYGEQPPPLDRELLWMQPCSFQQLQREQQPPASNPPAAAGTSAPHAPAGSAGCAASTASSSAQNAPAQEESPALDLGLEIEKMIREIRNSLPVKAPSAQGNINVAPESPREGPMNRVAAEEVSSGTESCGNSSPEPEEPDDVLLPDKLEEDLDDGAEPLAEPTTDLKELTDQIQAVLQRLDERGQAATKLLLEKAQELSTINAKNQEEPTSFSSQLTPMQQLLEQTAESSSQATPLPDPPVT
ncbi:hypothetical protein DUI87_20831 [Hirundo rustica rustica]|uniref:HSF-type DNA-binding domain-containing protein n=1 Tax=Hirundo rustica rustica TaxID=333673 RepID=A0A3M0JNK9_HIRRU|nr:hypothetical protein DUI87_20831 [Hirundo rustica rustica]